MRAYEDMTPEVFRTVGPAPALDAPFVRIANRKQLEDVAREFRNCLAEHGGRIAEGKMAAYVSVRRTARRDRAQPRRCGLAAGRGEGAGQRRSRRALSARTLVSSKGYFLQHLNRNDGWQTESPVDWDLSKNLKLQDAKVIVHIQGRPVTIRAWQYELVGVNGFKVPVIYLRLPIVNRI